MKVTINKNGFNIDYTKEDLQAFMDEDSDD